MPGTLLYRSSIVITGAMSLAATTIGAIRSATSATSAVPCGTARGQKRKRSQRDVSLTFSTQGGSDA